ncbi:hypothetical protein NKG05_30765 [Oerskovia sp. M15]
MVRNVGRSWGGLAHTAQRIRDQRAEAAAVAVVTQSLTEQGVRIIARAGGYYDKPTYKEVGTLRNKGEKAALSPTTHASCAGHAAYIDRDGDPVAVFVCTDPKTNNHLKAAASADPDAPTAEKAPSMRMRARAAKSSRTTRPGAALRPSGASGWRRLPPARPRPRARLSSSPGSWSATSTCSPRPQTSATPWPRSGWASSSSAASTDRPEPTSTP